MPGTMVDTGVITDALRLACRAPSLHNSQPWRWVLEGDSLHLFVDLDRSFAELTARVERQSSAAAWCLTTCGSPWRPRGG